MKYLFLFLFHIVVINAMSQKYALLDMQLSRPVKYADTITAEDGFNKYFAIEKQKIPEFLKVLIEIEKRLAAMNEPGKARQYQVGCARFTGMILDLDSGKRLDYVITSNCQNMNISMHLCDAKIPNADNSFFIKTWMKYIESRQK
jgi:hypothetical protein